MCNSHWNRCIVSQLVTLVNRTGAAGDEDDGIGVGLFEDGASESLKIGLLGDKVRVAQFLSLEPFLSWSSSRLDLLWMIEKTLPKGYNQ
nr:hypothetical protein Iba_chr15cCG7100 [Ipomoea batatas]